VIALGNPFGLGNSVTTGVVSARSRPVHRDGKVLHPDLIQTDALINIGNSGGPLLNITGEVIGINLGILEEGQGIGFAIPADRVRQAVASLLDFRTERMLRLGIPSRGLRPAASRGGEGLLVLEVEADGPAAEAGIRKGDLLLSVDGRPLSSALDLHLHLFLKSVGDVVVVRVLRGQEQIEARVTLGRHQDIVWELLGMVARDVTDDLGNRLELPPDRWYGVYVVEVERGGPADEVLIRPGDLLYFLGQFQINGIESLRSLLSTRFKRGQLVPVNLWRSETREELQGGLRLRP
jgi:serine protease Do